MCGVKGLTHKDKACGRTTM